MTDNEFKHKVIRDSVHGYISLSKTELDIVDTYFFQRLHRVNQLAFSYLVYPTAMHTRLEHALGSMHLAGRMCDQLGIVGEDKRLARLSALLHDIGHGPFSHTFESVMESVNPGKAHIHEHIGRMIIRDDPEIADCLGDARNDIVAILEGKYKIGRQRPLVSSIVSSNLDADKLDYFARDSYNLGVKYGVVDTERILHVLRHGEDRTLLGVHPKGVPVLDSYRLARYMIGKQIYTHHVRLAADQMFLCAVDAAFNEGVLDKRDFDVDSDSFLEIYKSLDDASFVHKIMSDKRSRESSEILDAIRRRKLLKTCYHGSAVNTATDFRDRQILDTPAVLRSAAADIRDSIGLRDHELVVHESDLPIRLFRNDDFLVCDDQGNTRLVGDLSPVQVASSALSYYVFGLADRRDEITRELAKRGIVTSSST